MESLSLFELLPRIVLAGVLSLTPGMLFWMLTLSLWSLGSRLGRRWWLVRPAGDAARP